MLTRQLSAEPFHRACHGRERKQHRQRATLPPCHHPCSSLLWRPVHAGPTRCATLAARHPRQIPFIVGLLATSMFLVPFGLIKRLGLLKTNISSVCKRQILLSTMHAFMMLCRRSIWCLDDVVSKCTLLEREKKGWLCLFCYPSPYWQKRSREK
jgi:hypothetical protein